MAVNSGHKVRVRFHLFRNSRSQVGGGVAFNHLDLSGAGCWSECCIKWILFGEDQLEWLYFRRNRSYSGLVE